MTLGELEKQLAKGSFAGSYLLSGEEALLRDDARELLRTAVLAGAPAVFNVDRLDGDSTSAVELRDAVGHLPVMGSRRLVILKEPVGQRRSNKTLVEALAEIVPTLAGGESTVLVVEARKADRRERWVRAIREHGQIVECAAPRPGRALQAFVKREASRQKLEIEAGVEELLAERVGPQLLMLRQELAKASLLAGEGQAITRRHVEQGSADVAEESIWNLTDAIGEGRPGDALTVLTRLLGSGAAPIMILGALASHFRKLARVRSGESIAGPPFVVRKLEAQARRYGAAQLVRCLRALHEADEQLKGQGNISPSLALDHLLMRLDPAPL